jgi:3-isopropylmalate/(R)-2-methylmalate dehydratase small subunit
MDPVTTIAGRAYPFGQKNVDTDVIIPSHWLKTITREGLGRGAFETLRKDPENLFDSAEFAGSPILIAGDNFGCGSSREHAAWALLDLGVRAVIAPSFSDIFSGNAFKNGILTVVLPQEAVDRLIEVAQTQPIHIDLDSQSVTTPFQDRFSFDIDPFRRSPVPRACLIEQLKRLFKRSKSWHHRRAGHKNRCGRFVDESLAQPRRRRTRNAGA